MKTVQVGVSLVLGALASTASALPNAENISALPAEIILRAWTDQGFEKQLKSSPGAVKRELKGANVHFDNASTINFVVMTSSSTNKVSVYGDSSRLLTLMEEIGFRGLDDISLQQLELLAYSQVDRSKEMLKSLPSIIPIMEKGIKVVVHHADQNMHYSIPINPIDIEHAQAIELQAVRVASSTTCCASGTCDIGGLPGCTTTG